MGYRKDILEQGKSVCSNNKCNKDITKKEYLYSMKKTGKNLCEECRKREVVLDKTKSFSKVEGFERYSMLKKK
jgi:hypothetical protein